MKHIPKLYLRGALTEEDEIAFEEHLLECATCRHEVATVALSMVFDKSCLIPFGSRLLPPLSRMPLN